MALSIALRAKGFSAAVWPMADLTWQRTNDGVPHVGRVPHKPGIHICAGFNGHGMPLCFLSAKGVAQMVREDCSFADTGVPACFETGEQRMGAKTAS